MTRLLISAGEASGDLHGADLARALQAQAPGIQLFGMGGTMMEAAGVEVLFNPTSLSTVGVTEALRTVNVFRRVLALLSEAMDERRPDGVVCIDFPGFNLRLAALAHRKGIPVLYYFSPSAWAWGRGRADRLARLGATILAVFPFEAEVYRQAGARVVFVGHPLLDRVHPSAGREEIRAELGVGPGQELIGLLPGSRRQELNQLLVPMLAAARIIAERRPGVKFVLPMAYTLRRDEVDRLVRAGGVPVTVLEGRTLDVLHAADAAIISMGTATLEAALMGLPHVACYRVSGLTYWLIRRLVKIPYFAMPNIVLGRQAVPEVIQDQVTGENLARELLALLKPERHAAVREQLRQVRVQLGEGGAVARAAAAVLERVRPAAGAS
ncbi:MAG TPA: lipid-A-disaccharide synthase [Limnochordales bacterium]